MNLEVNQLSVDVSVSTQISRADNLVVTVTFTNQGDHDVQVNLLFHQSATIALKIQTAEQLPIHPGPPPVPPLDDGVVGRKLLAPNEALTLTYRGRDYFQGRLLPPGIYQVKFHYENTKGEHNDWIGRIESEWMNFEVGPFQDDEIPKAR